ncbi:hypothetical protein ASF72_19125 [Arthrobacter sp. Leaf141]|uniref:non-ribosomal peptide synthetase n=1 Tax=Arthrobacter sp. Leaf141 TaxID=1736273 RepID=UPI0006FF3F2E|nr:condensation domain-containing protein [Arthrobacter sp. Leaf141]KQQ96207.1 hypothetical protein ASF72_19125 [Arthrobacter sp. Leaf141]
MTRFPLAPRQRRMWIAQQLRGHEAVYQITVVFKLRGLLDSDALEHAVYDLTQRHPALRSQVDTAHGLPEQIVTDAWSAYSVADLSALTGTEALQAERSEVEAASRAGINLAAEPALRVRLLRLADARHLLIVCVHHMMSDMISMDIIGRDLTELYNARVEKRMARLPELKLTYGQYAVTENSRADGSAEGRAAAADHWASILDGAPTRLTLPWDAVTSAASRGSSAVEGLTCARRTMTGLRESAGRYRTTLFTVLLAGFQCYLHGITGHDVTNVGTFVAVRHRSELENMVGLLFDEVPVVARFSPDTTFSQVVASVRAQLVDALHYTGNEVAEAARRSVDIAAPTEPPFNVTMQMYRRSPGRLAFDGLEAEQHRVFVGAKYDLMLYAAASDTGLDLWFNYDAALFERETVRRLLQGLNHLLSQLASGGDPLVNDLEIVLPAERARLLQAAYGPLTEYPSDTGIDPLFHATVAAHPTHTAVLWSPRPGETASMTYAELDAQAQSVAARLAESCVVSGGVVGVLVERDGRLASAYLGVLRAGASVLLLDSATPPEYVRSALNEAGATVVLADKAAAGRHALEGFPVVRLEEALEVDADNEFRAANRGGDAPAFLVRTSGTTGPSKAVVLGHRGIVNQVYHRRAIFDVTPQDVIALSLSVAFSALPMQLLVPLLSGATLAICDAPTARSPEALFEFANEAGVTILEVTPSLLAGLPAHVPAPRALSTIITAGEKLSRRLANDILERFSSARLATTWGQSEAAGIMCCGFVSPGDEAQEVSEGFPSANNRLYLLDQRMRPVPYGVEGHAYFAGPSVALGHIGTADASTTFSDDPWMPGERMVRTGDRAIRRPNGSVVMRGRLDSVVKVRGNRVDLGDVTAALLDHSRVREALAVVRRVDDEVELWAHVHADPGLHPADLHEALRSCLPEFMRPRLQFESEPFPRTPSGKVDALRLPPIIPHLLITEQTPPLTPWEQRVAEQWERTLGVPVDGTSDFFQLGGHSLKAMALCAAVAKVLGAPVSVKLVFERPVLRDFAAAIVPKDGRKVDAPN